VLPLPLLVFDMGVVVLVDDRLSTAVDVLGLLSSSMSLLGLLGSAAGGLCVHTVISECECEVRAMSK